MSLRPKSNRKLKKLPDAMELHQHAIAQKAKIDAEEKVDFDPITDVVVMRRPNKQRDRAEQLVAQAMDEIRAVEDVGVIFPPYEGPDSFGGSDFDLDPASVDDGLFSREGFAEAEAFMKQLGNKIEQLRPPTSSDPFIKYTKGTESFHEKEAWIQTYSGKRFTPIRPNPGAIVIQDIAHALSMQCRFSGHVKQFYSVAQHCVLVSHICDHKDALWGLLHDATEAFLVDVPRPLKKSGKFGAYMEAERVMQDAICERFGLDKEEPESVHRADTILLATEARDLMYPLRPDWTQPVKPLPFKIEPASPREAKLLYLERFFELIGAPEGFQTYLEWELHGAL